MATTFPNSVQTFPTMQDITSSDGAAIKRYQEAMQAGNISVAQSALASITNASNKLVTADLLNTVLDTCEAVQKYYNERYSPAYVVSSTQPTNQQATDFWFEVTT